MAGNHRSYQPTLPCGNKLLQMKWDQTYYNEHRRLVRSAKPMVDTTPPRRHPHLTSRQKQKQLQRERKEVTDRDNHTLLLKMQKIMSSSGPIALDRNSYTHHSLNEESRQRELQRITRENKKMLQRLNKVQPVYSVADWVEDWSRSVEVNQRITLFPDKPSSRKQPTPCPGGKLRSRSMPFEPAVVASAATDSRTSFKQGKEKGDPVTPTSTPVKQQPKDDDTTVAMATHDTRTVEEEGRSLEKSGKKEARENVEKEKEEGSKVEGGGKEDEEKRTNEGLGGGTPVVEATVEQPAIARDENTRKEEKKESTEEEPQQTTAKQEMEEVKEGKEEEVASTKEGGEGTTAGREGRETADEQRYSSSSFEKSGDDASPSRSSSAGSSASKSGGGSSVKEEKATTPVAQHSTVQGREEAREGEREGEGEGEGEGGETVQQREGASPKNETSGPVDQPQASNSGASEE